MDLFCAHRRFDDFEEIVSQNATPQLYLRMGLRSSADNSVKTERNIQQKLEDYNYCSYDGSQIWVIENCKEKLQQVENGLEVPIDSPVFFSSPTGYKMRAHLDMHGNDDARGTHMSLSVAIEPSQYDPILEWPFKYPIMICLFDQTGQRQHIVHKFDPYTNPICGNSHRKIIGGVLKLCPLPILQQKENSYVRNDKMFIKIMIDYLKTPCRILPYAMGINPALPMHIHDDLRRKMIKIYLQARIAIISMINENNRSMNRRALLAPHGFYV